MGYRKTDGSWHDECLNKLQHGEPFFVLRAQDKFASILVRTWAEIARVIGADYMKVQSAELTASEMEDWTPRKLPD